MPQLERDIESELTYFCANLGIRCEKLKLASKSGWPDRTLLYKGQVMFLELKQLGEKPTPLQNWWIQQLHVEGFEAQWADEIEKAKKIVFDWRQYVDKR